METTAILNAMMTLGKTLVEKAKAKADEDGWTATNLELERMGHQLYALSGDLTCLWVENEIPSTL